MNTSPDSSEQTWVIRPSKFLLLDKLSRHPLIIMGTLGTVVGWGSFSFFSFIEPGHVNPLPLVIISIVASLLLIITVGVEIFAFSRIQYKFTPTGFRHEHGIIFVSDFEPYKKVTDANHTRSIPEQFVNCGTVHVEVERNQYIHFRFVKDYEGLNRFFRNIVDENFKKARRINSL